ncbi:hypothetical protein ACWEU6_18185 [Streptosporangium sandarakinum]|uniref:hypothetical protein n=1 Tax=Streptosporangium sandarakinum TaxID=1260955 RepID=UPI0036BC04A8
MASRDEPVPTSPGTNPAQTTTGEGLRLARIGPVLALALIGSVLLSVGLFAGALWALGFSVLAPVGQSGIPLARLPDLLKLSFAVVAGIGGVVALVVAYRRQKVAEAAEYRQQAAELRADEVHQREATAGLADDAPIWRPAGPGPWLRAMAAALP